ncbi:hypothetical protein J6590_060093 [Homalodisca vitripennis]|nr:hypothetical protein J6590_060093 [Homalodisca vitripennis]
MESTSGNFTEMMLTSTLILSTMPARCALLALLEKKLTRACKSRIPDHVMPLLLNPPSVVRQNSSISKCCIWITKKWVDNCIVQAVSVVRWEGRDYGNSERRAGRSEGCGSLGRAQRQSSVGEPYYCSSPGVEGRAVQN